MTIHFSYFSNDLFASYKNPLPPTAFQTPIVDPAETSVITHTHFSTNNSSSPLNTNEQECKKHSIETLSNEALSNTAKESTKKLNLSKKSEKLKRHPFFKEIKQIKAELSTPNQFWTNKKGSKNEYCQKFLNRSFERFTLIEKKKGKQKLSPELDKNDSSLLAALFPLIQQLIESKHPSSRLICLNLLSLYFSSESRSKDEDAAKLFDRYLNQISFEEGSSKQEEEEKNLAEKIEESIFTSSIPLRIDYATIGEKFLFTDIFKSIKYLIKHIEVFKDSPSNFNQYESRLLSFLEDCPSDQFATLMNLLENAPENFKSIFDKKGDRLFYKIYEKYFSHPWLTFEEKITLLSNVIFDQDLKKIIEAYSISLQNEDSNSFIDIIEVKKEALISLQESVASFLTPSPNTLLLIIEEIIGNELMKYDLLKGIRHFIDLMKMSKKISSSFLKNIEHIEDWLLTCSDNEFIFFTHLFSSFPIDLKKIKEKKVIDLFNSIYQRFLKLKIISFDDDIRVLTFLYSISPIFKFPVQTSTEQMLELIELHKQMFPNSSDLINPLIQLSKDKELSQEFKVYVSGRLFSNIIKNFTDITEKKEEILIHLAKIYCHFKNEDKILLNLDKFIPLFFKHFYLNGKISKEKTPLIDTLFMDLISLNTSTFLKNFLAEKKYFPFLKGALFELIKNYFDTSNIYEKDARYNKKIFINTIIILSNYIFGVLIAKEQRSLLSEILNEISSQMVLIAPLATHFTQIFFKLKDKGIYEKYSKINWCHYYLLNGLNATKSLSGNIESIQIETIKEIIHEKSKSQKPGDIFFGLNLLEGKEETECSSNLSILFDLYKQLFEALKNLSPKKETFLIISTWMTKQKEKIKLNDSIFNRKIPEEVKNEYKEFINSFLNSYIYIYKDEKNIPGCNPEYFADIKKFQENFNESETLTLEQHQNLMTIFFSNIETK